MAFTLVSPVVVSAAAAAPGRRVAPKRNVAANAQGKGFEMPAAYKKIAPTADRVLVKIAEAETTTAGGIILAETAQRKPTSGDVVSLGPDCKSLEKGNTVLYNKFGIGCTDLEMGDDSYIVIKEQDLIGTFPGSGATASDIPKMSPLGDRILIKPEEVSNTSAGGIMLTDGAVERPSTATVIAAGPGKKGEDGELVEMKIKKGDKVMFFKYAGDKMYDSDGLEYIVVRELDILATM